MVYDVDAVPSTAEYVGLGIYYEPTWNTYYVVYGDHEASLSFLSNMIARYVYRDLTSGTRWIPAIWEGRDMIEIGSQLYSTEDAISRFVIDLIRGYEEVAGLNQPRQRYTLNQIGNPNIQQNGEPVWNNMIRTLEQIVELGRRAESTRSLDDLGKIYWREILKDFRTETVGDWEIAPETAVEIYDAIIAPMEDELGIEIVTGNQSAAEQREQKIAYIKLLMTDESLWRRFMDYASLLAQRLVEAQTPIVDVRPIITEEAEDLPSAGGTARMPERVSIVATFTYGLSDTHHFYSSNNALGTYVSPFGAVRSTFEIKGEHLSMDYKGRLEDVLQNIENYRYQFRIYNVPARIRTDENQWIEIPETLTIELTPLDLQRMFLVRPGSGDLVSIKTKYGTLFYSGDGWAWLTLTDSKYRVVVGGTNRYYQTIVFRFPFNLREYAQIATEHVRAYAVRPEVEDYRVVPVKNKPRRTISVHAPHASENRILVMQAAESPFNKAYSALRELIEEYYQSSELPQQKLRYENMLNSLYRFFMMMARTNAPMAVSETLRQYAQQFGFPLAYSENEANRLIRAVVGKRDLVPSERVANLIWMARFIQYFANPDIPTEIAKDPKRVQAFIQRRFNELESLLSALSDVFYPNDPLRSVRGLREDRSFSFYDPELGDYVTVFYSIYDLRDGAVIDFIYEMLGEEGRRAVVDVYNRALREAGARAEEIETDAQEILYKVLDFEYVLTRHTTNGAPIAIAPERLEQFLSVVSTIYEYWQEIDPSAPDVIMESQISENRDKDLLLRKVRTYRALLGMLSTRGMTADFWARWLLTTHEYQSWDAPISQKIASLIENVPGIFRAADDDTLKSVVEANIAICLLYTSPSPRDS